MMSQLKHVGRIEVASATAAAAERQRQRAARCSKYGTRSGSSVPSQLLLSAANKRHQHLDARAGAGGRFGSVAIRSNQRLAAAVSPERQAASASNSRAVWRNGRSAAVSGSSRVARFGKRRAVDQERAGAQRREILQHRPEPSYRLASAS